MNERGQTGDFSWRKRRQMPEMGSGGGDSKASQPQTFFAKDVVEADTSASRTVRGVGASDALEAKKTEIDSDNPHGPEEIITELDYMRVGITKDRRFADVLGSLVTKKEEDVTSYFTPSGAVIFDSPDQQERLDWYVTYAKSFNEYLDDLMYGSIKDDDQYPFREGEANGTRTGLGKSGIEGQVYNFPPYVVKERRSDLLEKVSSDKYIPRTQIESLMVMEGLRSMISDQTDGVVSIPEHYGIVSFELESSEMLARKPKVELMIMEKVGDAKGTTAKDVEKGKAYQDRKAELQENARQALELLRQTGTSLPQGVLRDLGSHNLLVNPESFDDATKPLFFLIDQ